MDNIWAASPAVALLSAIVIQALKRTDWFPWITRETAKVNSLIGAIIATLTGLGLAMTFDFDQESGRFAAGFSGNLWDIMHAMSHVPIQWAEQQGIYKLFISLPESAGETRAIQRDILNHLQLAAGMAAAKVDVKGNKVEE